MRKAGDGTIKLAREIAAGNYEIIEYGNVHDIQVSEGDEVKRGAHLGSVADRTKPLMVSWYEEKLDAGGVSLDPDEMGFKSARLGVQPGTIHDRFSPGTRNRRSRPSTRAARRGTSRTARRSSTSPTRAWDVPTFGAPRDRIRSTALALPNGATPRRAYESRAPRRRSTMPQLPRGTYSPWTRASFCRAASCGRRGTWESTWATTPTSTLQSPATWCAWRRVSATSRMHCDFHRFRMFMQMKGRLPWLVER